MKESLEIQQLKEIIEGKNLLIESQKQTIAAYRELINQLRSSQPISPSSICSTAPQFLDIHYNETDSTKPVLTKIISDVYPYKLEVAANEFISTVNVINMDYKQTTANKKNGGEYTVYTLLIVYQPKDMGHIPFKVEVDTGTDWNDKPLFTYVDPSTGIPEDLFAV